MPWKIRGGHKYWYETTRDEGGRVRQVYYGAGMLGQFADERRQMKRRRRALERTLLKTEREDCQVTERIARKFLDRAADLAGAVLLASGCHKVARTWRRKRGMGQTLPAKVKPPAKGAETAAMFARAAKGDESVRPQVLALLDDEQRGFFLVHTMGDMSQICRRRIIEAMSQGDILMEELLRRNVAEMIRELAGEEPSFIEQILSERAAVCWLLLWRYENRVVRNEGMTIPQLEYQQKLITAANNRLNAAIKTLCQVRRLALPALKLKLGQMNLAVGAQQVVNERGSTMTDGVSRSDEAAGFLTEGR
jgi:hypothetical protein